MIHATHFLGINTLSMIPLHKKLPLVRSSCRRPLRNSPGPSHAMRSLFLSEDITYQRPDNRPEFKSAPENVTAP